jgi:hypothetical protein
MDILENILPRGCVISLKARSVAGDIAQPRGSIFPIYPCHAHYITIALSIGHCYQRIDLPVKKGPLLIYGCAADLLHFTIKSDGIVFMLFEYVPTFISVH